MTHLEIVQKLVGRIDPIGETNTDDVRFENLKVMCELVNDLVSEIYRVVFDNKEHFEYSRKRAADYAQDFMTKTLGISE